MTKAKNRDQASRLILFTILWLILFVLSVKVSVGWATRSLSLLAESLHTLISGFSILLSLFTIIEADHPTGREVYGHGKRESVVTLLLTAFLGFACSTLLWMSAAQLVAAIHGRTLPFPAFVSLPMIGLLGGLVATSLGLALLGFHQAIRFNSPALRFNASQLLIDVGLTILVIVGLVGSLWSFIWLDLLLTILLVILAIVSFWRVLNWQLPMLVQQTAIAPEVLAEIARQVGGVTHCYKIRSRGIVGRRLYIQMHLILHPDFKGVSSLIAERIEGAIRERYGSVQVTLYIDDDISAFQQASNLMRTAESNLRNNQPNHTDIESG